VQLFWAYQLSRRLTATIFNMSLHYDGRAKRRTYGYLCGVQVIFDVIKKNNRYTVKMILYFRPSVYRETVILESERKLSKSELMKLFIDSIKSERRTFIEAYRWFRRRPRLYYEFWEVEDL
jgi:hypothetical protein